MSDPKHTPIPWRIDGSDVVSDHHTWCGLVAAVYPAGRPASDEADDELAANARLIASAPELLNALSDLSGLLDDGFRVEDIAVQRSLSEARDAIAKALGSGLIS